MPITLLSSKGRRLLEALVSYFDTHKVYPKRPATYPTYENLYRTIVPDAPAVVLYVGHNLRKKGLDELNDWTLINSSLPKVTGLIVDKARSRPGKGFFPSHKKTAVIDDNWWHNEVRKALVFDWSPYIGSQQANSPAIVATDLDEDILAPRVKGTVSRIVRDTKFVREVKALHAHKCQICGDRIKLSPTCFYSEGHHLKPLGKPHNGPDKIGNIICVCPNCHVKLDFSAMKIDPTKLRTVTNHLVRQDFINYHNRQCI